MNLAKMQDLGGCRIIVDNIQEVYQVIEKYKNSKIKHILKKEDDYIQTPKESGYRSYHLIYQFQSSTKEIYNKNIFIEIQARTKLQHTWATAVEMMGMYTKSQLKASQGDTNILRFFALVSSLFANIENTPIVPDTTNNYNDLLKEIRTLDNNFNILSTLNALSVATKHIDTKFSHIKNTNNLYFILILNFEMGKARNPISFS